MLGYSSKVLYLLIGIISILVIASVIGFTFKMTKVALNSKSFVDNFNSRVKAWWVIFGVFAVATLIGDLGAIILFALISFLALREFITITPTTRADHKALFWTFFIIMPLQYYFIYNDWYGMFVLLIPVYAFLFIPIRMVIAGEYKNFMERSAKIQWGLMCCVFCVSHAPAILKLQINDVRGGNIELLIFFVIIVQLNDVMQYCWGKTFGKRKITPKISPNKTWEGFLGGILSTGGIGAALAWATPFSPGQAFAISVVVAIAGFCGDITLSAIKRDVGIKDYGNLIEGHGGILDRIDSLCFAAPIFFHIVRFFFVENKMLVRF